MELIFQGNRDSIGLKQVFRATVSDSACGSRLEYGECADALDMPELAEIGREERYTDVSVTN